MYLVFDMEFGGLDATKASLLDAYFAVFDKNFNKVDDLWLSVKPKDGYYIVEPDALRVNKIDLVEHSLCAEDLSSCKTAFYDFLKRNREAANQWLTPVGHNMYLDVQYLFRDLMSKATFDCFASYVFQDTAVLARFLYNAGVLKATNISLGGLIEYFNIEIEGNLHNARYDALATMEVYKHLTGLLK